MTVGTSSSPTCITIASAAWMPPRESLPPLRETAKAGSAVMAAWPLTPAWPPLAWPLTGPAILSLLTQTAGAFGESIVSAWSPPAHHSRASCEPGETSSLIRRGRPTLECGLGSSFKPNPLPLFNSAGVRFREGYRAFACAGNRERSIARLAERVGYSPSRFCHPTMFSAISREPA